MEDRALQSLPDGVLRARLRELSVNERSVSGELLRHLGEYDARKLYEGDGLGNLWTYCARVLKFADAEIGLRIQAAKAVHANPHLLAMLERGETSVSSIGRLAPHLKGERKEQLIEQARGMSLQEVRWLVATEKAAEKIEAAKAAGRAEAAVQSGLFDGGAERVDAAAIRAELHDRFDRVVPLSGEEARLEAVVSREFVKRLERAQILLARRFPKGRIEDVVGLALELLLDREDPQRREARRQARALQRGSDLLDTSKGRRITRRLRDRVLNGDGGRCAALEQDGSRCAETRLLEIDHKEPLARGGRTIFANLQAACPRHNKQAAVAAFGEDHVNSAIQARKDLARSGRPRLRAELRAGNKTHISTA